MFGSMQTLVILTVKVFIFHYYAMMDNTPAKNAENHPKITEKSSHPAATFSVLPEKMPDN